ncbi:DUF1254 domain-containing protein [Rhizobium metallidurans]|uniref:Putative membrane protein n=1 Tax=Rhizobium metallidurans TaxID=1265931 RepID=A0A7W6GCA1_9HYPH|nr:DUF1254 domain-containing protein [Rhizobium metallidurans]MBB3965604.1 putative membrane protein [Rhizobium metallidurans]
MLRVLFALLAGLFGAALLHLVIILSLPHFTGKDAATRVALEGDLETFYLLGPSADTAGLSNNDPFVRTAVCSFDIEESPVRFTARGNVPFWSVALFDDASNEIFSMNDRTSVGGAVDILIGSPIQLTELRKSLPQELQRTILVETTRSGGYAVLRTLAPQASFEDAAKSFLSEASCQEFAPSN